MDTKYIKFDPWLLGAIEKSMGKLPLIPGDLAKIKSLTFYDVQVYRGEPGTILNGWIEISIGNYSAIEKMYNLHTILFKNHAALRISNFDFLLKCQKIKKLDLSGTDFSDCSLLSKIPSLNYILLPDRRRLIHTEILEQIKAKSETESERDLRSMAKLYLEEKNIDINMQNEDNLKLITGTFTADIRLIEWIASSLGKLPKNPADLSKIKLLDSRNINYQLDISAEKLPSWLTIKDNDFSLIGKLPNLKALHLWGFALENFSFLSECNHLLFLNLYDTNFTNCRILLNLPNLKCIYLPETKQLKYFEEFCAKIKNNTYYEKKYIKCEEPFNPEAGFTDITFKPILPEITKTKTKENDSFYRDDEFDDMPVVQGENITISYDGGSKVRHISADFWSGHVPDIWNNLNMDQEDEDNYANLNDNDAKRVIYAITNAILNGDIRTLYLSLDEWGEDCTLGLEFSGNWATAYYDDFSTDTNYWSYNPAYTGASELSPVDIGGQTPVPKMMAFEDLKLASEIAGYFLETGQLLPGTLWKISN